MVFPGFAWTIFWTHISSLLLVIDVLSLLCMSAYTKKRKGGEDKLYSLLDQSLTPLGVLLACCVIWDVKDSLLLLLLGPPSPNNKFFHLFNFFTEDRSESQ